MRRELPLALAVVAAWSAACRVESSSGDAPAAAGAAQANEDPTDRLSAGGTSAGGAGGTSAGGAGGDSATGAGGTGAGGASQGADASTRRDTETGDTETADETLDEFGYGISGFDFYPPLKHRAQAVPCTGAGECTSDEDCGAGMACFCSGISTCIPAECYTDGDCDGGLCLYSRGPEPSCCGSGSVRGLYCERPGSPCPHEDPCPGNGAACVYVSDADRFECRVVACSDCP